MPSSAFLFFKFRLSLHWLLQEQLNVGEELSKSALEQGNRLFILVLCLDLVLENILKKGIYVLILFS